MLLKLSDVKKIYRIAGKKKPVLNGVNLNINQGEIVSITGKSGCGKTTLLNIIAGLTSPDEGYVFYNGRKVPYYFDFLLSKRRNLNFGFIFQTFKLLDNENVMSNVLLPAKLRGRIGKDTRSYIDDILGKLKIYKYKKSKVSFLSGGQKQRVAIARALVNRPSLILADEPTANLDKDTSIEIFQVLEELKEENRAVLIITHKEYMHKRSDFVYNMADGILTDIK